MTDQRDYGDETPEPKIEQAGNITLSCNQCEREVMDCPIICIGDFPHGYRVIGDQLWQCRCGNRHLFDDGDHIHEE